MKRKTTPTEQGINLIIRRVGVMAFAAGVGVGGLVLLLLGREFIALHCTLSMALGALAGALTANATVPRDPASWRKAGARGGLFAALGFGLPFAIIALANFFTVNETSAGKLLAAMTSEQVAQAMQNRIDPSLDPVNYFRAQFVSYIFGYPLVGGFVGWLAGVLGGALTRKRYGN